MPITHESHSVLKAEVGFTPSNSLFYSKQRKIWEPQSHCLFISKYKKNIDKNPRQYIEKMMFTAFDGASYPYFLLVNVTRVLTVFIDVFQCGLNSCNLLYRLSI